MKAQKCFLTKTTGVMLVLFATLFMSSCTKTDDSTPIVLPAGTDVQYSTADFFKISEEYYDVELKKYDPIKKNFSAISDITPTANLKSDQVITYTLPKDKNTAAVFIVKVNLSRQTINFESFVLPNRITNPSLASTLLVELLREYPNRTLDTYREDTILAIDEGIKNFIRRQNEKYPKISDFSLDIAYRFYKNGLSSDYEFLELLSDYDINFDYTRKGVVTSDPYPFGRKNSFPVLDLANSTPTSKDVRGIEKVEVFIRGQAVDGDNDHILYAWKFDGKDVEYKSETEFRWTPDYDGFRSTPYAVSLFVTDGGTAQELKWNVYIANLNRKPLATMDCPKEIKENETVRCQISVEDNDNEKVSFTLRDVGVNARATLNTLKTDNTSRTVTINDLKTAEFVFTPNNKDALKRSAYFQIDLEDESQGVTSLPIAFGIIDTNLPPDMVGTFTAIAPDANKEWDYCEDPGNTLGTETYDFYVSASDPDNINATEESGFDIITTPTLGGSLNCSGNGCIESISCPASVPASTPQLSNFCYRWRASHDIKTGSLNYTFIDDHGGRSEVRKINLTATDRNQKPCVQGISSATSVILNLGKLDHDYTIQASDNDLESPYLSVTSGTDSDIYPFLYDITSGSETPLIFRNKPITGTLGMPYYRRSVPTSTAGLSKMKIRAKFLSPYSGVVKFSRPWWYTSNITIPKGTIVETDPNLMPYFHYKYKTEVEAVMQTDDNIVWVPVTIFDQSVAAGKLDSFKPQTLDGIAVSSVGLTISNAALIDNSGDVVITRSNTAAKLILPKFLEFYSSDEVNPATSTVRYFSYKKVEFAIGQATATVNVAKIKNRITQKTESSAAAITKDFTQIPFSSYEVTPMTGSKQDKLIFSGLPDPSIAASYVSLYNYTGYSLNKLNAEATKSLLVTAEDSYNLPAGTTLLISGDITKSEYKFASDLNILMGSANLIRVGSAAQPLTSALTLPSNTEFISPNETRFKITNAAVFSANATTASVYVQRTNHTNPTPAGDITLKFSDKNFKPVFIVPQGALNLTVNEGINTNDFLIEVNDNAAQPGAPNDPLDRHTINIVAQSSSVPKGQLIFCREKGDSLMDINSPACTPCTTQVPADYWDSARCYVRFFPRVTQDANSDIDLSFNYIVTAEDNSPLLFGEEHFTQQTLTIKVNEINDAPIFTNNTWNAIGSAQLSPYTCGSTSCADFVESNESSFTVYASDSDRNTSNKTLSFSLDSQIYDNVTGAYVAKPAGLTITNNAATSTNVYGGNWGSRYSATIKWMPNDYEAKNLAGAAGFTIKVKVTDAAAAPNSPLSTYAYYKVTVQNINNQPKMVSGAYLNTLADTYVKTTPTGPAVDIILADSDVTSLGNPINFTTSISLCESESIFDCTPTLLNDWPTEVTDYQADYTNNSGVPECRTGSGLNTKFVRPYLTRKASRINNLTKSVEYPYQIEWCPQRGQLGGWYYTYLNMNDNGDKDRNGVVAAKQQLVAPLYILVNAPVFFKSPKKENGVVTNVADQAFIGKEYLYKTVISKANGFYKYELIKGPLGLSFKGVDNNYDGIEDVNATLQSIFFSDQGPLLKWTPTVDQLSTENSATWHTVELKVTESFGMVGTDTVIFKIQVKDAFSPAQVKPVIGSKIPSSASIVVDENRPTTFSVAASDANTTDRLFYSWYVGNLKKYDGGPSFSYKPNINDYGPKTIRLDVTDGFYTESVTWSVYVRNTVPNILATNGEFNLTNFNNYYPATPVTNIKWNAETAVETMSGVDTFNSILFSGSYTKSSSTKNFVYNLKFKNGTVIPLAKPVAGNPGNPVIAESLPWAYGKITQRLSYKKEFGTTFNIITTPLDDRNGAFTSSTTNATCLPNTLGITSFNSSHLCNSTNAGMLYKNKYSSGNLLGAVFSNSGTLYDITITKDFSSIQWTNTGVPKVFYNVASLNLGVGMRFAGIAVSDKTQRIYVTARDIASAKNRLLIFDANPLLNSADPNLIATLNIFDGTNPDNKASEIIVINDVVAGTPLDKVYVFLPGTGGLALLPDNNSALTEGDMQFIGLGEIGKSATDDPVIGRKLAYNTGSKLIYGISKGSNQLFSVDVATNIAIAQPTLVGGLDAIVTFSNDATTYAISRTLGQIFKIQ